MTDYANRSEEFQSIMYALKGDISTIFLIAGKAYGITSFLKNKLVKKLKNEDIISFYINANNDCDFSSALLQLIIKDMELYSIMQDCIDRTYGEKDSSFLQSVAKAIPYAGEMISHIISLKTAAPLYTGNFSSAIEEILTIFFNSIRTKKIVIIIDAAQNLLENSYDSIYDLIKFNNVKFLFAITENDDNYRKLKNFINLKHISNKSINFCAPYVSLIIEIGKLFNRKIDDKQAKKILLLAEENIHRIIEEINNTHDEYHLDMWAKAIISVLNISSFPLELDILYNIVSCCHLYAKNSLETFKTTLNELLVISVITQQDGFYELRSLNHPEVKELLESFADQIVYKKVVLQYWKSQNKYDKKNV